MLLMKLLEITVDLRKFWITTSCNFTYMLHADKILENHFMTLHHLQFLLTPLHHLLHDITSFIKYEAPWPNSRISAPFPMTDCQCSFAGIKRVCKL